MKKLKKKLFGDMPWIDVIMLVTATLIFLGCIAFALISCCSTSTLEVHSCI